YLSSIAEFAPRKLVVVGILSRGRGLRGRLMRQHNVLGAPEDISVILAQLELHGVSVHRVVVVQPFEQLAKTAREALLEVERTSAIKVEWLHEMLGWTSDESALRGGSKPLAGAELQPPPSRLNRPRDTYLKRMIDLVSVTGLMIALSPLLAVV